MVDRELFRTICTDAFRFLDEYKLRFIFERAEPWGYEIRYANKFVGIIVISELRDFYPYVQIAKLRSGEFPPKEGKIRLETILHSFDLDDLVGIRSKESLIPPLERKESFNAQLMESQLRHQARNLQQFAGDALSADFSVFSNLDKLVKNRAREAAMRKWGDKASQYGWS